LKKVEGISRSDNYHSIHLYREDLEQIIDILSEISEQIEISDGEYVYDSLDELITQKGLKPKKIFIRVLTSTLLDVTIRLKFNSIWLSCSNSDKDSLYAYDRIREILTKKRSILSRVFNPIFAVFVSFSLLLFLILVPFDLRASLFSNYWRTELFFILLFGIPVLSVALRLGCFSSFNLIRSNEQINFFSRQKDDLIKIVIGAIIGALFTLLISQFT